MSLFSALCAIGIAIVEGLHRGVERGEMGARAVFRRLLLSDARGIDLSQDLMRAQHRHFLTVQRHVAHHMKPRLTAGSVITAKVTVVMLDQASATWPALLM